MTFTRQVLHFVRFDLQRTRWWWGAYAALLIVTSLVYFGQPLYARVPATTTWALPLLTWLVAMGLAITAVQGDSPLSLTAFWQGKPVHGQAIGIAKLVTFALVMLLACVVALLVWRVSGMPVETMREGLPRGATSLLRLVMVAAVFGAVTRSFGSALLLLVGVVIMLLVLGPLAFLATGVSSAIGRVPGTAWTSLASVSLLLLSVVVIMFYRGNRLRGVRSAKLMAVVMLLAAGSITAQLGEWIKSGDQSRPRPHSYNTTVLVTADAPSSMPETIRFDSLPRLTSTGGSIGFEVVGARADRRYELEGVRLVHTASDRTSIRGGSMTGVSIASRPPAMPVTALPLSPAWQWSARATRSPGMPPRHGLLYGSMRISASSPVDTVHVEGTAVRYRAEEVARVPFTPGLVYADTFATIHLRRLALGDVALVWASFAAGRDEALRMTDGSPLDRYYAFAVLDSTRRAAHWLTSSSDASYPEWLVLPGTFRTVYEHLLDNQFALRPLLSRGNGSPATLIVYRWVEDGRRRVHQAYSGAAWPRGENAGPTALIRGTVR